MAAQCPRAATQLFLRLHRLTATVRSVTLSHSILLQAQVRTEGLIFQQNHLIDPAVPSKNCTGQLQLRFTVKPAAMHLVRGPIRKSAYETVAMKSGKWKTVAGK